MTALIRCFYPFANSEWHCERCGRLVCLSEAVGVYVDGKPCGVVHEECPGDGA